MSAARDFRSSAEAGAIAPIGPVAHGWIASDLNPHGVVGEARLATADKGRLLAERFVADVIGLLGRVADKDISGLRPIGPRSVRGAKPAMRRRGP